MRRIVSWVATGTVAASLAAGPVWASPGPGGSAAPWAAVASGGSWGALLEVPGTGALNTGGNARVSDVSCTSAGNCAAVGFYTDSSRHQQPFVADEVRGTWHNATRLPGTIFSPSRDAAVNAVSCASAGNCGAAGWYTVRSGRIQVFVASLSHGRWGKAIQVPGIAALDAGGRAFVAALSCPSAGNCSAGGFYEVAVTLAFVASEVHGSWHKARHLRGTGPAFNDVGSVSCWTAGNCAAGGSYAAAPAAVSPAEAFVANENSGTWGAPHTVPGTATLNAGGFATVMVSCPSAGNCGGAGTYTDSDNRLQAFVTS